MGAGHRARRDCRSPGCGGGHGRSAAHPPAASHPHHSRRGKPAERRERPARVPPRRRSRCRERLLLRRGRADVLPRHRREHRDRAGARLAHAAGDGPRHARPYRDHPPVRHHVRRVDDGRTGRPVGRPDRRVLCHCRGADGACANARAGAHPDVCGVGNRRVRAEHPGVHLHRPPDSDRFSRTWSRRSADGISPWPPPCSRP